MSTSTMPMRVATATAWRPVSAKISFAYSPASHASTSVNPNEITTTVGLAISTSGNSPNVLRAVEVARDLGVTTVGLLGKGGGTLGPLVDIPIVVPLATTSDRIQELHIKVIHITIEAVELVQGAADRGGQIGTRGTLRTRARR